MEDVQIPWDIILVFINFKFQITSGNLFNQKEINLTYLVCIIQQKIIKETLLTLEESQYKNQRLKK